jgi:Arm DNA-binding domain
MANPVAGFLWYEDLRGFGLRITFAGAASYVVQYRMAGREAKSRRFTIGSHGSPWTPATARAEATRLLVLVTQGIDPVESDKQRWREAVDLAFSNYADHFAKSCKGKGWSIFVKRSLRLHVKPVLRDKALPAINRIDTSLEVTAAQIAAARDAFATATASLLIIIAPLETNPFEYRRVHPHFALSLPEARSINPITGTNWQDVGVKPDVPVPADQALETALRLARERLKK